MSKATIIHVNTHNIRYNLKESNTGKKPVIKIEQNNHIYYSNEVKILDVHGQTIATIKYCPNKPLSCGAKVWIETDYPIDYKEVIPEKVVSFNEFEDQEEQFNVFYPL